MEPRVTSSGFALNAAAEGAVAGKGKTADGIQPGVSEASRSGPDSPEVKVEACREQQSEAAASVAEQDNVTTENRSYRQHPEIPSDSLPEAASGRTQKRKKELMDSVEGQPPRTEEGQAATRRDDGTIRRSSTRIRKAKNKVEEKSAEEPKITKDRVGVTATAEEELQQEELVQRPDPGGKGRKRKAANTTGDAKQEEEQEEEGSTKPQVRRRTS